MAFSLSFLFQANLISDLFGTIFTVVTAAVGVGIVFVILIMIVQSFRQICFPNELLVFTGREYKLPDGRKSNMKILFGGGGWRIPLIEKSFSMDMTTIPIEVQVQNAYSKGNIPLMVQAIANIKTSNDRKIVGNAIERFLDKSEKEVQRVAKETLEANLRNILATLTPEQVNEDRLRFAGAVSEEVEEDLEKLGLMLDTLKIQHVSDDSGYLDSIGRRKVAEALKNAEIAESDAHRESETFEATQLANAKVSEEFTEKGILQAQNKFEALKAELDSKVNATKNEIEAAARESRANAERELQEHRQELERLRLQAEVVLPALAEKTASELRATGEASPILENGKAVAASSKLLAEQWSRAGEDAKSIYLIQQIERLTDMVVASLKEIEIKEVNLIDDGKGNALPNYIASFPNTVTSILNSVQGIIGVDIPEILKQSVKTSKKIR